MKVVNAVLFVSIAVASTSAWAAAGDQLLIANGHASSFTTYDNVMSMPGGFWATGITYDAASGRYRPLVTAFAHDGSKTPYNTGGWSNGTLVMTDLSVDATSTAAYYPAWGPNGGGMYVAVQTPTTIEVYTVAVGNLAGSTHPHSYSFPHGVNGGIKGGGTYQSEFVVASARQTAGGVFQGVLIRPGVTGFGTNGIVWISGGTGDTRLADGVLCDTSYICAVGRARDTGGDFDTFAVKVSVSSGALATGFDGDGKKRYSFGVTGQPNNIGKALFMDGSQWIILSNVCGADAVCDPGVARLTSSGAFDTTFSGDGKNVFDMGGYSATAVDVIKYASAPTRFYICGQAYTDGTFSTANSVIFAFTTSGSADTTYGTSGLRTFNNYTGTGLEVYSAMTLGADTYGGSLQRVFVVGDRDTSSGTVEGVLAKHVL